MENTPKNDSNNQNELDLGLNSNEPVTPRKTMTDEPSFLNKFFRKKEATGNPFAERREPTFGADKVNVTVNPGDVVKSVAASMNNNPTNYHVNNGVNPQQPTTAAPAYSTLSTSQQESVSSVQNKTVQAETVNDADDSSENEKPKTAKSSIKNPEDWKVMQKLPHKHRRLFIAIAAAVVILAALLLLKPRSETVEDFQANSNGNAMPIEFQSLDPNKPLENTEAANTDNVEQSQDMNAPTDNAQSNEQATVDTTAATNANTAPAAVSTVSKTVSNEYSQTQAKAAEQARLEKAREEAQRKAEQQAQAAKLKAEQQAKEKARLAQQQAKVQTTAKEKTPVVDAKPAGTKSAAQQSNATSGTSKTLTVPAGTSLFQVFRSNGLDIRDANAMTKASGANNVLSSFKANDKVQVAINSEGRVSTMRLSDGSIFTRQSNGTYKYSK